MAILSKSLVAVAECLEALKGFNRNIFNICHNNKASDIFCE